jgi:hypothetical protein
MTWKQRLQYFNTYIYITVLQKSQAYKNTKSSLMLVHILYSEVHTYIMLYMEGLRNCFIFSLVQTHHHVIAPSSCLLYQHPQPFSLTKLLAHFFLSLLSQRQMLSNLETHFFPFRRSFISVWGVRNMSNIFIMQHIVHSIPWVVFFVNICAYYIRST